jgi:CheY-like chemotaxis protein
VIDTGEGMPLHIVHRAFDPFFTTKALGKGTGLGLAQVYGVARQAGGDARIASAPGGGTTVTLLFREAGDAPALEAADAAVKPAPPPASATVLLVDDDEAVRSVVRGGLEMRGFKVLDASSGAAALELAGAQAPQIAVIDYAMPGMDGAETADHLRRMLPNLPIILASGHADTAAVERVLGGAATVMRKPFDITALSDEVTRILAQGT